MRERINEKGGFHRALLENVIKNVFIFLILVCCYRNLHYALRTVDAEKMNNFLLIISIFLLIICFANFTFTYSRKWIAQLRFRLLSHLITTLFLLLIGFLLEAMMIAVRIVYPGLFYITTVFVVLLYLGLAVFDFWDFLMNC